MSENEVSVRVGYRVSTEEQARHEAAISAMLPELEACLRHLSLIEQTAGHCGLAEARSSLLAALSTARMARGALAASVAGYTGVELAAQQVLGAFTSVAGYVFGLIAPLPAPWLLAAIGGIGLPVLSPDRPSDADAGRTAARAVLSNPVTVELIRAAAMGSDDALGGLVKLPPAAMAILGEHGLAITGVHTSAGVLLAMAGLAGVARETPVTVTRTSTAKVSPPHGARERLARIPSGIGQVRVERYPMPSAPARVEVYIGGTVNGSVTAGTEPWDMTSNLHGAASAQPASLRAVEQAMQQAGVQAGDRVAVTGYSQGALVGALLASEGDYRVDFLLEAGGPSGQVPVPEHVTHVRLDHSADPVTALGGDVRGEHTIQVRRDGVPDPGGAVLPAHDLDFYLQTAALADASADSRLADALAATDRKLAAADTGTATTWRGRRVSGAS